MKKTSIILILLVFNLIVSAQITQTGIITNSKIKSARFITLENSGNKYYLYDHENLEIRIYNMDNTLYKSITISPDIIGIIGYPNWGTDIKIFALSENVFDTDNEIEFIFSFTAYDDSWSSYVSKMIVMNNDGSILFEKNNSEILGLSNVQFPEWIETVESKMILKSNNSDSLFIFDLAPITQTGIITNSKIKSARFITLENSGKKYYLYDHENLEVRIYNMDNTLYESITISPDVIGIIGYPNWGTDIEIFALSENVFNTDNEIEFIFSFTAYDDSWSSYVSKTIVMNNDGSVLFEKNNNEILSLSNKQFPEWIETVESKMMLKSNNSDSLFIFSLPSTINSISQSNLEENKILLYPNPTTNYIFIKSRSNMDTFFLYNANGEIISISSIGNHVKISLNETPSGVYLYQVQYKGEIINNGKLIIK